MIDQPGTWGFFRPLTWNHVLVALAILAIARLLAITTRRVLRFVAEDVAPRYRLGILRVSPPLRAHSCNGTFQAGSGSRRDTSAAMCSTSASSDL